MMRLAAVDVIKVRIYISNTQNDAVDLDFYSTSKFPIKDKI